MILLDIPLVSIGYTPPGILPSRPSILVDLFYAYDLESSQFPT